MIYQYYHNASSIPKGNIPLVSCGDLNNGIIRCCDLPQSKRYNNVITVAYNGQPLTTKFHPYVFGAKDDVAVCIPKMNFRLSTILYLQYIFNREKWRYSYGRKCFRDKLSRYKIQIPVKNDDSIDEDIIEQIVMNIPYWNYFQKQVLESEENQNAKSKLDVFLTNS